MKRDDDTDTEEANGPEDTGATERAEDGDADGDVEGPPDDASDLFGYEAPRRQVCPGCGTRAEMFPKGGLVCWLCHHLRVNRVAGILRREPRALPPGRAA